MNGQLAESKATHHTVNGGRKKDVMIENLNNTDV